MSPAPRTPWRRSILPAIVTRRARTLPIVTRTLRLPTNHGVRIALVTDIHAHPRMMPIRHMRTLRGVLDDAGPLDLVVLGGDLVADRAAYAQLLSPLAEDAPWPVVATAGNHDVTAGLDEVADRLGHIGIRMLVNETWALARGVELVGLASERCSHPRPSMPRPASPDIATRVVMGHEPSLALLHDEALHLSGHTHHGQIRIPWVSRRLIMPEHSEPYPYGLHERSGPVDGRGWVATSAGVGFTGIGVRVCAPPEIVIVHL